VQLVKGTRIGHITCLRARVAESADATDFPPEAGLPLAGKSVVRVGQWMDLSEAIETLACGPSAYVLQGVDSGRYYRGACRDLVERLKAHRGGSVSRTKGIRPLRIVYFDACGDYSN